MLQFKLRKSNKTDYNFLYIIKKKNYFKRNDYKISFTLKFIVQYLSLFVIYPE